MKIDNKQIINILDEMGAQTKPLTNREIDEQYQLFLDIKKNVQTSSSLHYKKYTLIKSNIFMSTAKKVSAYALIAVIGISSVAYGADRVSAFSLANQISNASNISAYSIDLGYSNVLLNGKNVSKEYVAKQLDAHHDNLSVIGGITGYKGTPVNSPKVEDTKNWASTNVVPAEALPVDAQVVEVSIPSNIMLQTTEDFAKELGVSLEEAKKIKEDAKKNPYGPGFSQAIKFLELKEGGKITFIGLDNANSIIFFAEM